MKFYNEYLFHPASASDDCIWRYCQTIRSLHLKPLINVKAQAKCPCPALWIGQHPDKEQLRTNPSLTELNYNSSNCTLSTVGLGLESKIWNPCTTKAELRLLPHKLGYSRTRNFKEEFSTHKHIINPHLQKINSTEIKVI